MVVVQVKEVDRRDGQLLILEPEIPVKQRLEFRYSEHLEAAVGRPQHKSLTIARQLCRRARRKNGLVGVLNREFLSFVLHCLNLNVLTLVLADGDKPVYVGENEVNPAVVLEYRKRLELRNPVHALANEQVTPRVTCGQNRLRGYREAS